MNRPFRGGSPGGVAYLGEGINQGVNSFVQNFLNMKRQGNYDKWQAAQLGTMRGQLDPLQGEQPAATEGAVGADVLAKQTPQPDTTTSGAAPSVNGYALGPDESGWAQRTDPSPYVNGSAGEAVAAPSALADVVSQASAAMATPVSAAAPSEAQDEDPAGAQALATPVAMEKPVEEMSLEEIRNLAFNHAQTARKSALENHNNMDMLHQAFHYDQLMKMQKPYLDQWVKALNEVKANPSNPDKWRSVSVLTGEEDPHKALAKATQEYSTLRGQYDQHRKNYEPLNKHLSARGITPDQYANESQFIQLRNKRKFEPHTPNVRNAGTLRVPKPSRRF